LGEATLLFMIISRLVLLIGKVKNLVYINVTKLLIKRIQIPIFYLFINNFG